MSELEESPTHVETLITSADITVIDIEGRPTIAIEDGLEIVRAVNEDIPGYFRSYALLEGWMQPTPDLREQILAKPVYEPVPLENIHGHAAARWLGHEAMDRMAVTQGLPDFSAWLRNNAWQPTPENDDIHPYCRISDGGVITDIEGRGIEIPSWQGIIGKYGAKDPVVQEYFLRLKESVRLDAAMLLNYITSHLRIRMMLYDDVTPVRVTSNLDSFLLDEGYIPDQSRVNVIEL